MLLESDSSWLTLAGPYPMLPRLSAPVSGVDHPSVLPRQLLLFASLLSSRNCFLSCPATNCPLCSPATNCPLLGRVVNSHSRPLTTSGYGEISCPRILCLVSRQNRQLNRLLWQPNHIVLHKNHMIVTVNECLWIHREGHHSHIITDYYLIDLMGCLNSFLVDSVDIALTLILFLLRLFKL